jgi:pyrimidine operon attenuation protein/uracil phosphoribosyltransferase
MLGFAGFGKGSGATAEMDSRGVRRADTARGAVRSKGLDRKCVAGNLRATMDGQEPRVVMDADEIARALRRMAGEITEHNRGAADVALVGIRRGGVPLADRLRVLLRELERRDVPVGTVDINLYRDDTASLLNPLVGRSDIPFDVDGRAVVLVDDVLFTGRTIRAGMDALLDYGRPRSIQLLVLIDRGHRELPIQPDYCGRVLTTTRDERVDVTLDGGDAAPDRAVVVSARSPREGASSP